MTFSFNTFSFVACLALLSITPVKSLVPKWPPTYQMNTSTAIMVCNASGYMNAEYLPKLARYGIVDIDWSNAKLLWSNTAPMDCQERLLTQAKTIKSINPSTKVWVYRNLVKALPWFTDIRTKLLDPRYNEHWFLKFKPQGPYHMPPCTGKKCSMFYHDQLQTPHHPSLCHGDCNCGKDLPCGEYLYDHRNASLQDFLVDVFVLGPKNGTGLNNDAIDGFYLDDGWTDHQANRAPWMPKEGFCDTYNKIGGPTEEDYKCIDDMNLSQSDVSDITKNWRATMDVVHQKIVDAGGFDWQLFRGETSPNQTECSKWLRSNAGKLEKEALMLAHTKIGDMSQQDFEVDLAMFLLMRGEYGWLGYQWNGCHSNWMYQWNEMLDMDYGVPMGGMKEIKTGVFQRKWSKCVVEMDCNAYKPSFQFV